MDMDPTGSTGALAFFSGIVIIITIGTATVIVTAIIDADETAERTGPIAQCASFSVITPPMISAAPSQRPRLDGSPKNHTPTTKVPAAPMPVQTA
jgi:hypothetical protein